MTYQGKHVVLDDFSGGEEGSVSSYIANLPINRAALADNIILMLGGRGFFTRKGVYKLNETELGTAADGFPVTGLAWLSTGQGSSNFLVAVKKDKIYRSSDANATDRHSATFSDITGAVVVTPEATGGADAISSRWSFTIHNDTLIAFGGQTDGPSAPWKCTGTGNASALGGSPPTTRWCFAANNRVFAGSGSAGGTLSTLYWSVLGNAEDWTGTGSGSTIIGSLEDGEPITAGVVLSQNFALIFKLNSIYRVDLTAAPFSSQLLFKGAGARFGSAVVADGKVYFITANGGMGVTDGNTVQQFTQNSRSFGSSGLSSQSAAINAGPGGFRLRQPFGFQYDYDLIVWHDPQAAAVAWDLKNKCWLHFSTGMKFTVSATDKVGYVVGGGNATRGGFVYTPEGFADLWTDDSEGGADVDAIWRSGWINPYPNDSRISVPRFILHSVGGSGDTVALTYGYAYSSLPRSATLEADNTAGNQYRARTTGLGSVFAFRLDIDVTTAAKRIHVSKIVLGVKGAGQVGATVP